jgi:nucleotide-binding universal stress UspA family protein
MRAEAREAAEQLLDARQARIADIGDIRTETLIREGNPREAIEKVVADDPAIAILVLAASSSKEGPGTLITEFVARSTGGLPVVVTIIPASMTDAQIIGVS